MEELLGRIMSYAGLVYSGDTTDPARMKFYGDTQEKITAASSDLLFFELELNRLDDALTAKLAAGALKHYRPWLEDIRKGKPYQLDDKLEQLFHENRSLVSAPGTGFSTRRSRACASLSMARLSRSSPCSI